MSETLSVLIVEDSASDAELLVRGLGREDFTVSMEVVDTAAGMQAALAARNWDVVISDYVLPGFNAPAALAVLQQSGQDIPFIVVSGKVSEDIAVDMMKLGAHDFMAKDRLSRLGPAIKREMREAKTRQARLQGISDLAASEMRYRRLFEAARDGILILDAETGMIIDANPYLAEMTGHAQEELVGKVLWEIDIFREIAASRVSFAFLQDNKNIRNDDLLLTTNDGKSIYVELTSNRFLVKDKQVIQCTIRDVSLRKQAERNMRHLELQLLQEQKMAAIGTLSSGVAHEINNPLTGVLNYAQLVRDRLPETSVELRGFCDRVIGESNRIATIVHRLLEFSRKEKIVYQKNDLGQVAMGILSVFEKIAINDQIDILTEIEPGLPPVCCSTQQIQQVVLNLLTNARDALNDRYPQGGTNKKIRVRVARNADAPEAFVRVAVYDLGNGIPAAAQGQVFDPFFTTKDALHGTGLGLSISEGIVREHGGHLTFETLVGTGTSFYLDLPVDDGTVRGRDE